MRETRQPVSVVGLGYIGLPTASILASRGHAVRGVDVRPEVVDSVNSGRAHFVEPDLDMLVSASVEAGRLRAYSDPAPSAIFILCVPTPLATNNVPDLRHVFAAGESIVPHVRPGNLVVVESTCPPGTTERVAELVRRASGLAPSDLHFAHAPERVLPGQILREVIENDRLIGGVDEASTEACVAFYSSFTTGKILRTNARTAETVKLLENAFRDVNIAFANEVDAIAERLHLNARELIDLANHHPRVNILSPGPGVGGHCIAVDPWFLVASVPDATPLIRVSRAINDAKPLRVINRIMAEVATGASYPTIACLGLAYKANVSDLRESPALQIVRELVAQLDGEVRVVEPNLHDYSEFRLWPIEEALDGADLVVILVAHSAFLILPDLDLAGKRVLDICGISRSWGGAP